MSEVRCTIALAIYHQGFHYGTLRNALDIYLQRVIVYGSMRSLALHATTRESAAEMLRTHI